MKFQKIEGKHCEYLFHPLNKQGEVLPVIWAVRYDAEKSPAYLQKSLKTKDLKTAQKRRDELFLKWRGAKESREQLIFQTIHDLLIEQKKPNSREATINSMKYSWKRLEPYIGTMFVKSFRVTDWKEICATERRRNPDTRLFNIYKHMTALLNYAFESGLLEQKIKIKNPDEFETKSKVYTPHECKRLLREAEANVMKYMIPMALKLGMRTSEITQLKKSRIDLKNKVIRLTHEDTKTKEGRVIPMGPVFKLIKEKYESTEGEFLFPSPYVSGQPLGRDGHKKAWLTVKKRAKVSGRFYDLRHTCATNMAKTMAPALAAKILGHSLKMFFDTYLKPSESDLRAEMEKLNDLY